MPSWQDIVSGEVAPQPSDVQPTFTDQDPAATQSSAASSARGDADSDGLSEEFENQVADLFTPYYHVSTGEKSGTGFALFRDSVPQVVQTDLPRPRR
jgi:hypothetical protein